MDRVEQEVERINSLLDGLPQNQIELINKFVENVAWLGVKLDDARSLLDSSQIVMNTDSGIKKNPAFESYNALLGRYADTIRTLISLLPEAEVKRAPTTMDAIRKKREKRANTKEDD